MDYEINTEKDRRFDWGDVVCISNKQQNETIECIILYEMIECIILFGKNPFNFEILMISILMVNILTEKWSKVTWLSYKDFDNRENCRDDCGGEWLEYTFMMGIFNEGWVNLFIRVNWSCDKDTGDFDKLNLKIRNLNMVRQR